MRKRRGSLPHVRVPEADGTLHEQQEIENPMLYGLEAECDRPAITPRRYYTPRTRLPQDLWPEISERHAKGESLRQLGKAYGVSYESVRQVIRMLMQVHDN